MSRCEHKDFEAQVDVNRLEDSGAFVADIRIKCKECGLPFEFPDIPVGLNSQEARVSVDSQELRLPIKPRGSRIFPAFAGISGFDIHRQ